jgi:hypothetical protein
MLFGNLLPGADERAGDHRRPEEEVEAAGDASRRAFKDARPCPRREREDGVHEPSRADVLFLLLMVGGGYVAMAARTPRMYGAVRYGMAAGRTEAERVGVGERERSFEKYQWVSIA